MHRLPEQRSYVGTPGETVSITTQVDGGGQAGVVVGGQPLGGNQFQLPSAAGATVRGIVSLAGPQGASCVVTIAVVDGATDRDLLLCTVHNPVPSHQYDFATAAAAAVATLGGATAAPPAPSLRPRPGKPAKKKRPAPGRQGTPKKKGGR